ncbi:MULTISPECIES: PLP-dependent aminotransferase family protein [unclassified Mycobacterium]|uniref:MocR-like transcription factor YczR n=1 Tax=unclassified Mycobacterium TaxID=2642494 RepID=UPI00073FEB09|nr:MULTISPECIES: PLP-dependent aminotransferase family protein [unclassified Mycobacterium]KUH82816.1 GntR family transcriptional regulator [Mycobacterium sp. IS-1556]KUH83403.1 GntR family transcriptional regulator [Mycobacterium sp. GA-0227b]KUH84185.1 GntR family transcriptional regulator [Mycobacterium sp. GA-1999]
MTVEIPARALDVDLLVRELGNWRTSSRSGPAYRGLADAIRLLIVDGRVPVGARLPSERALADVLRVSRTTVTGAYTQLREDGYLIARRGARSTTALPVAPAARAEPTPPAVSLAAAALSAPAAAVMEAFAEATHDVTPYLHAPGHELVGVTALRQAIAERYCERGLLTEPDEIMVTTGALHAIGLILTTYVQPGDRVLVEQPTYHGALSSMMTAGARPVPVAMTETGWDLDALQSALQQLSPSLAYLIPDNQNPTGLTMPAADRKRLARIIAETRTRTVIDETILDMWLDEPVPGPIAAEMASRRDLVLTVGSMSKSFWGGLRVGWIRAERATIATLAALRPSVDMGTAVLEQCAAARLLARHDDVLPERRAILRSRRAHLQKLLSQHLPDWQPGPGAGGMSLWVRLPAPMSTALSAAASRLGLDLPAGPRFGVDGTLERFVRVPYALPEEQLSEAVELLARSWHSVTGLSAPEPTTVVV